MVSQINYPEEAFAFQIQGGSGVTVASGGGGSIIDLSNGGGAFATVDTYDPLGLVATYNSVPGCLRLPVGIWALTCIVGWDTGTAAGILAGYVQAQDTRSDGDPVIGAPYYLAGGFGSGSDQTLTAPAGATQLQGTQLMPVPTGIVQASDALSASGQGFAVGVFAFQTTGDPRVVTFVSVEGFKIADVNGPGEKL